MFKIPSSLIKPLKICGIDASVTLGLPALGNCLLYHNTSRDTGGVIHLRKMDGNADGSLDSFRMTLPFALGEGTFDAKTHAQTHKDLLEQKNNFFFN